MFLLLSCRYSLWIQDPSQIIWDIQIFSPTLWIFFSLSWWYPLIYRSFKFLQSQIYLLFPLVISAWCCIDLLPRALSWPSSGWDPAFAVQGACVWFLFGELRSSMLQGQKANRRITAWSKAMSIHAFFQNAFGIWSILSQFMCTVWGRVLVSLFCRWISSFPSTVFEKTVFSLLKRTASLSKISEP